MRRREVLELSARIREDLDRTAGGRLHVLINNAGCARNWYATTEDGIEQQFALNYLAGFVLTHELLEALLRAGGSS